eukprot:1526763-Prymnesium_polylepis.1
MGGEGPHVPEMHELLLRQHRTQASTLLTLEPILAIAGGVLRHEYDRAVRQREVDGGPGDGAA